MCRFGCHDCPLGRMSLAIPLQPHANAAAKECQSMPPSFTPIAIKLLCERREYQKQADADGRGKEELHSVIVPGDHTAERKPNHRCRNNGQRLQSSTLPNASEVSGIARPLRCFRASIPCGWARWISFRQMSLRWVALRSGLGRVRRPPGLNRGRCGVALRRTWCQIAHSEIPQPRLA